MKEKKIIISIIVGIVLVASICMGISHENYKHQQQIQQQKEQEKKEKESKKENIQKEINNIKSIEDSFIEENKKLAYDDEILLNSYVDTINKYIDLIKENKESILNDKEFEDQKWFLVNEIAILKKQLRTKEVMEELLKPESQPKLEEHNRLEITDYTDKVWGMDKIKTIDSVSGSWKLVFALTSKCNPIKWDIIDAKNNTNKSTERFNYVYTFDDGTKITFDSRNSEILEVEKGKN